MFTDLTNDVGNRAGRDIMSGQTELTVVSRERTNNSLCGPTKDVLSCNREPSADSPIQLSEIVHDPNIRRVTDIGLGHGEMST